MSYPQPFITLLPGQWLWVCVMKTLKLKKNFFSSKISYFIAISYTSGFFSIKDVRCGDVQMYYFSNDIIESSLKICIKLLPIISHILKLWVVISVFHWDEICSRAVVSLLSIHCQQFIWFLMSVSGSQYVGIKTNAYCTLFQGQKFSLRMNFNTAWFPDDQKQNPNPLL